MTWSTESISTTVKSKKDADHAHSRKKYSIISRRPSARHRVLLSRSRHYSTSAALQKKSSQGEVECSNSPDNTTQEIKVPRIPSPPSNPTIQPGNSGQCNDIATICEIHPEPSGNFTQQLNTQSLCEANSRDLGPQISVIQDSYEDLGPKISILRDSYDDLEAKDSTVDRGERSWNEDIGPAISIVKDFYGPDREQRFLQNAYRTSEVKHCIICAEVCQYKRKQNTDSVSSERLQVVKTKVLRRSVSKRNKTKFSIRKRKSMKTPSQQSETENERIGIQEDNSVSLEDIAIDFKTGHSDSPQANTQVKDIGASIIRQCIETDTSAEQKRAMRRSIRYPTRKPKCRKIHVQMCRRPRKILVLGDMTSGKTNLISAYGRDKFTENYIPTILNCYQTDAKVEGESIDLVVVEISGRDDFEPLRRRAYRKMDGAVICYSVDSVSSLNRVRDFWVPELRKHVPKAPFVLVGTKKDLRDNARDRLEERLQNEVCSEQERMSERLREEARFSEEFVLEDRGKRMANSLGADGFIECSSLYRDRTREVFESVTNIAMRKTRRLREDRRHLDTMCAIM